MLFNSLQYAIFLPVVFAIYWWLPHKYRWALLLAAGCYFYMSLKPEYIVLLAATTVVSYAAGLYIEKTTDDPYRKAALLAALLVCLFILFIFKYFNFFSRSLTALTAGFSHPVHPVTLKLMLPVGISFYTFKTLSYVIDVYKRKIPAERHFGIYAAYVSFFPQLTAGPIDRPGTLIPRIREEKHFNYDRASYGLKLMAWGYFKKLAIADAAATYVDTAYMTLDGCTGLDLLMAVFLFTVQIYCDFSGYTDIAAGSAGLLGIDVTKNFNSPYFAGSIKEFWSRWHISLSTWFRDYVYIPLGGNRCSTLKRDRNLLVTFLLSGLWHGADWTFVVWGGIHGIGQIIEDHLCSGRKKGESRLSGFAARAAVFAFCNAAWIFFRADSIKDAFYIIKTLVLDLRYPSRFRQSTLGLDHPGFIQLLFLIAVLAVYDHASLKTDVIRWISGKRGPVRWTVYILIIWVILAFMPTTGNSEFIYFKF